MAYFHNPEPFEDQGDLQTATSPEELKAFYHDMEQREIIDRKLSKRKSQGTSSLWSRKSLKRSSVVPTSTDAKTRTRPAVPAAVKQKPPQQEVNDVKYVDEHTYKSDPLANAARSLVPEILRDLPAWYKKDDWTSPSFYRTKFPMYNPTGPKYYKNHHLVPPSVSKPSTRPPTVFSPSFPPMSSSPPHEHSEDVSHSPDATRTVSHTNISTPSSSQIRVGEAAAKPRSRKNSQTAHDGVDLLDVSDPWGTNWHHTSPYDIGLKDNVVSPDVESQAQSPPRSRHSSIKEGRRRTITPSPLSQSTSAIHLQVPDPETRLPRKLSKRKTPLLGGIFHGSPDGPKRSSTSVPTSPSSEYPPSNRSSHTIVSHPKTLMSSPPSSYNPSLISKKERRGSILGRIAKRFSVLRKQPSLEPPALQVDSVGAQLQAVQDVQYTRSPTPDEEPMVHNSVANEQFPLVEASTLQTSQPPASEREADAESLTSIEATSYSIGKLTVANPDESSSVTSSPVVPSWSLPSENEGLKEDGNVPQNTISSQTKTEPPLASSPMAYVLPSLTLPISVSEHEPALSPTLFFEPQPEQIIITQSPQANLQGPSSLMPSNVSEGTVHTKNSLQYDEYLRQRSVSPDIANARSVSPPVPPKSSDRISTTRTSSPEKQTSRQEGKQLPLVKEDLSVFNQPNNTTLLPYLTHMEEVTASPLSTASMVVHPPSPYIEEQSIAADPPPLPPKNVLREQKRLSADQSPGKRASIRQTEQFKLVRSQSGNVFASGETIRVEGEQWEVMEDTKRFSSHSKDKQSSRKSAQAKWEESNKGKRDSENEAERTSRTRSRAARQKSADLRPVNKDKPLPRANSLESHRSPDTSRRQSVQNLDLNKPQPAPPVAVSNSSTARPLERVPSVSARPTSEVPSSADLNAMRAKEAYDMDRLWKAKSMYSTEPLASSSPPLAVAGSDDLHERGHGSSHTSFSIQNPFIHQPKSQAQPPVRSTNSESTSHHDGDKSSDLPPLANPLPEPPRPSSFQPLPIPDDIFEGTSNTLSADYWTKL